MAGLFFYNKNRGSLFQNHFFCIFATVFPGLEIIQKTKVQTKTV
jgi:hypothetical protein